MYNTLAEFFGEFEHERGETQKIMNALSDASLKQAVAQDHRTLGRIAWHLVTTYPEMTGYAGIVIKAVGKEDPVPATAAQVAQSYQKTTQEMIDFIKANWKDSDLQAEKDFYGEKWTLGLALKILIKHEIHHRGQMTVLMRQAGLKVPGVYGPAKEDWANYGQNPPTV